MFVTASNVKHNLNDNCRSSGFVRPKANVDTLTSTTEDIKHLTNNDIIVFGEVLMMGVKIIPRMD
jgi:hypothetical protein